MSDNINTQKKEIISREIKRLKKNNRAIKKQAPYALIFMSILSFTMPFFPNIIKGFAPENAEYIEASLINYAVLIVFYSICIFIVIRKNKKQIDTYNDTFL